MPCTDHDLETMEVPQNEIPHDVRFGTDTLVAVTPHHSCLKPDKLGKMVFPATNL